LERTVILIIDKIYIAERVEYSGAEVQGLTVDGNVASTLLCFMIKSLVSKYKDIVAIYPMDKLTAAKQYDCYNDVMATLHSTAFNVVAISVDNAATKSTRDVLHFYAANDGKSSRASTADFLTLILKLWNVLNVKTRTKGKHKRDYTMDPVLSSLDWKLEFLREFAAFVLQWEQSGKPGLSKETSLALHHTCLALADCASFLLDRRGFQYVLLGHIQSDAIESRFGWLRQLSGANYYISMRQVTESDKKNPGIVLAKILSIFVARDR